MEAEAFQRPTALPSLVICATLGKEVIRASRTRGATEVHRCLNLRTLAERKQLQTLPVLSGTRGDTGELETRGKRQVL